MIRMMRFAIGALIVGLLIVLLISLPTVAVSTGKNGASWDEFSELSVNEQNRADPSYNTCSIEVINVYEVTGSMLPGISNYQGCVTAAQDFSYVFYSDSSNVYRWAVRLSSSSVYVPIENIDFTTKMTVAKGSNTLVYSSHSGGTVYATLSSFENGLNAFESTRQSADGMPVMYRLKTESSKKWLSYTEYGKVNYSQVHSYALSTNGRYILAWVDYSGYIRLDLQTGAMVGLGRYSGSWQGGVIANVYAAAITNDGNYAFLTNGPSLIDVSECGYEVNMAMLQGGTAFDNSRPQCVTYNYTRKVEAVAGYRGYANYFKWVGDEESLEFVYSSYPYVYPYYEKLVTLSRLKADGIKFDYLALGDSFSSGEGDIGKQADGSSFYLPNTANKNGCHVSSRSYPFVLARLNNIQSDRIRNVACSGARIAKDYHGQSTAYLGQSEQLKDKSETERSEARDAALKDFTPGILKQIDFVKENKPKFVTLTGGGNDVGFGPVLNECATSVASTCSYALSGDDMAAVLGSSIKQQYESMRTTIGAIQEASPDTTIYVVGYPKFLTSEALSCGGKAGALDRHERVAVNQGVEYLNDVIRAAANSKGAHYIDIEDSLSGGRLCESAEYVTGVVDAFLADDLAQAFHPNAAGHEKMASSLTGNVSFRLDNINPEADASAAVPAIPSYFGADESVRAERKESIVNKYLSVRSKVIFAIQKGVLKAGSRASISIHSKAKNLGTHIVASDGSLVVSRNLPNDIATGYHTVLVKGTDAQGAPLWLYQFVYVEGNEPDTDKDGIPNGVDKCQFRAQVFDEPAQKFVCARKS